MLTELARKPATFVMGYPVFQERLSQAQLVNAAIAAEPDRAQALTDAFLQGWNFTPGQLGPNGLPLPGELPRPTRGGTR